MGHRRWALLSVSDKAGIVPFARQLIDLGFGIVSTGGTAGALRAAGLEVQEVSELTGFPEILGGRVKTLHPRVHGGILGRTRDPRHVQEMSEHAIEAFELVAVNLYPFEAALQGPDRPASELVELIDVGGPAMVRAAAKNHEEVAVVVDPAEYEDVVRRLKDGGMDEAFRGRLAAKAFAHTAFYDAVIAQWLAQRAGLDGLPETLLVPARKAADLRYGENHHQRGAFYHDALGVLGVDPSLATARQLHGKALSYNNLLDGDTGLEAVKEFTDPTVVIIKHATPSGIASDADLTTAWRHAYATDTYSPFGGVVAFNRRVTAPLAGEVSGVFLEMVLAPSYEPEALERLRRKKNLRIMEVAGLDEPRGRNGLTMRSITGGLLLQDRDLHPFEGDAWRTVTRTHPTPEQVGSLVFAARCAKHVRSNAVVFAKGTRTVGIGGGQTARVDAVHIATKKGGPNIEGSVMASDAFFPFRDTVDAAAEAGVAAIVQPGGSIRDDEVIKAADGHGIAMVFNGHRSFRH